MPALFPREAPEPRPRPRSLLPSWSLHACSLARDIKTVFLVAAHDARFRDKSFRVCNVLLVSKAHTVA